MTVRRTLIDSRVVLLASLFLSVHVRVEAADGPATRATQTTTRPTTRVSTHYGAERVDFEIAGRPAFVIRPTAAAAAAAGGGSRPWVWYAPTFAGKLPGARHDWIMRRLLDGGFAIAGIDVGESYGSPAGRRAFDALYDLLTGEFGLARQACLLPQSRGGLMLYNWAVEHPERVRCVAGIYPVCDLQSYPGLARAAPAYGMTERQLRAALAEHNPVDRLRALAEHRVPILHLHGDRDTIVPLDANSGTLVKRYQTLGGPGELHVVEGKGHEEVDAFFCSERLLAFLLSQRDRTAR